MLKEIVYFPNVLSTYVSTQNLVIYLVFISLIIFKNRNIVNDNNLDFVLLEKL